MSDDPVVVNYTTALRNLRTANQRVKRALEKAPSSRKLAEAIKIYHICKQAVNDTWQDIPETQRRELQPPDQYD